MENKRRRTRQPRVADNPMAELARQVVREAADSIGTADDLAARMEPHLRRLYGNSAIYQYVNGRAVPPGDVLLAAAAAAGISLDARIGVGPDDAEVEELRTRLVELAGQMGELQRRPAGGEAAPEGDVRSGRVAQRRRWARDSTTAQPAPQAPQGGRSSRRNRGA